jgi:hypothetical protein
VRQFFADGQAHARTVAKTLVSQQTQKGEAAVLCARQATMNKNGAHGVTRPTDVIYLLRRDRSASH